MTKEKQHAAIGAAIVLGSIAFLFVRSRGGTASIVSGASPTDLSGSVGVAPPSSSTAGAAIPGTDISLGGSPTYLTYNYPAMLNGLLANPPWGTVIPPADQAGSDEGSGAGCCTECSGISSSPQWTQAGIVADYWPITQDQGANYASVGLNAFGEAPTGF